MYLDMWWGACKSKHWLDWYARLKGIGPSLYQYLFLWQYSHFILNSKYTPLLQLKHVSTLENIWVTKLFWVIIVILMKFLAKIDCKHSRKPSLQIKLVSLQVKLHICKSQEPSDPIQPNSWRIQFTRVRKQKRAKVGPSQRALKKLN